jgi:hypothetical protein
VSVFGGPPGPGTKRSGRSTTTPTSRSSRTSTGATPPCGRRWRMCCASGSPRRRRLPDRRPTPDDQGRPLARQPAEPGLAGG